MVITIKSCDWCKKEFTSKSQRVRFCCEKCKKNYITETWKEYQDKILQRDRELKKNNKKS